VRSDNSRTPAVIFSRLQLPAPGRHEAGPSSKNSRQMAESMRHAACQTEKDSGADPGTRLAPHQTDVIAMLEAAQGNYVQLFNHVCEYVYLI
jgi:hypothetical protein